MIDRNLFDITSGAIVNGPATERLNVYELQVVEGSIQIRIAASLTGP